MNKAVLGIVALLLFMSAVVYASRGVLSPYLSQIRPRASVIPLPSSAPIVPVNSSQPSPVASPAMLTSPRLQVNTPSIAPRPSVLPASSNIALPATGL